MGRIVIRIEGSFGPSKQREFFAATQGHVAAVADAIAWLSKEVLPASISLDHRLANEGASPSDGFGPEGVRPK